MGEIGGDFAQMNEAIGDTSVLSEHEKDIGIQPTRNSLDDIVDPVVHDVMKQSENQQDIQVDLNSKLVCESLANSDILDELACVMNDKQIEPLESQDSVQTIGNTDVDIVVADCLVQETCSKSLEPVVTHTEFNDSMQDTTLVEEVTGDIITNLINESPTGHTEITVSEKELDSENEPMNSATTDTEPQHIEMQSGHLISSQIATDNTEEDTMDDSLNESQELVESLNESRYSSSLDILETKRDDSIADDGMID
jgi:hypothetical protein